MTIVIIFFPFRFLLSLIIPCIRRRCLYTCWMILYLKFKISCRFIMCFNLTPVIYIYAERRGRFFFFILVKDSLVKFFISAFLGVTIYFHGVLQELVI